MRRAAGTTGRGRESDPWAQRAPELPGLELREKLGQGSLGFLYSAVETASGRTVAMKVLRAHWNTERERVVAALERLRALGPSPFLGAVEGPFEAEGRLFLRSACVEGEDLGSRIQRAKEGLRKGNTARSVPLPDAEGGDESARPFGSASEGDDARRVRNVARLVAQVCEPVARAHARGSIHGNLKPTNVLVAGNGAPVVTDFGFDVEARALLADEVPGTVDFLAPEQARGSAAEIGPWTDVFALGALLYDAIALELPFPGPLRHQTLAQIVRARPAPWSAAHRQAAGALERVARRALQADPAERYRDAEELASELERVSRGEEPRAGSPRRFRWWPRVRRSR